MNRRITSAAVMLAGCLIAAGCGVAANTGAGASGTPSGGAPTATTTVSASADKDALLAAVHRLDATSYHYTLASGTISGQGEADPPNGNATAEYTMTRQNSSSTVTAVEVGTDLWLQLDANTTKSLGLPSGDWLHIDTARLGAGTGLPVDPSGAKAAAGLLAGPVDVRRVDTTHYSGTVDLTKATGMAALDQVQINGLGIKARSVPFTAQVDDQGRLTDLTVNLSSVDSSAKSVEASYSDFGAPVSVSRPTGTIVEAPNALYQLFGK